jgi:phosphoglycerate dehydrogenase-like enzyme
MSDPPLVLIGHDVSPERTAEFRDAVGDRVPADALVATTAPDQTRDRLPDADAAVAFRFPSERLEVADRLRWIQALSAGVDHYDRDALVDRGIALTNASGVHAEPLAEQVLGYLLTFERNLHEFARNQHRGVWQRNGGGELRDRTVGIVGVGAIGTRVAELASAFDSTVLGTKRDPTDVPSVLDGVYGPDGLWELLERADYLVVACPLTDETRGLIGTDQLRVLSEDAVVVNIARGEIIDQDALVAALQARTIRGAALDVFEDEPLPSDSPLWDLPNAVVTPHVGGSTPHYLERCADLFVENYERFRAGDLEGLRNRVH